MWVKRSGFYVKDKELYRKDVWVDWNLETPKDYMYIYTGKIKDALGYDLYPIVDTTSYSPNYLGKKLNSYWNKINGVPCINMYNDWKEQCDPDGNVQGVFEYIYYLALDESNLNFIKSINCFSNMFYNPDKNNTCDAKACAILKLLIQQNKLDYINNIEKLMYWTYCNTAIMNIISAGEKPIEEGD